MLTFMIIDRFFVLTIYLKPCVARVFGDPTNLEDWHVSGIELERKTVISGASGDINHTILIRKRRGTYWIMDLLMVK